MADTESSPTDPTVLTTEALHREIAKVEALISREIAHLRELRELDEERRVEQKVDTKERLDAAFAAAKEAVGKSEINFTEQLKQQQATFTAEIKRVGEGNKALDDKMAALFKTLDERIITLSNRVSDLAAITGG